MNEKVCFDNLVKSTLNDSAKKVEPSKDIFNEAWNKREQDIAKRPLFNFQFTKKVALVAACFIVFFLGGAFTFLPEVRVAAQELIKTIFLVDNKGNIVETTPEKKVPVASGSYITPTNKEMLEKKLGFKINLPEKIGAFSLKKFDGVPAGPIIVIMADDVEYEESEDVLEKLTKAANDEKVFDELKDYKISLSLGSGNYVDGNGNEFSIGLSKKDNKSKKDNINEINMEDIKASLEKAYRPKYETKGDRGPWDLTKKPIRIDETYFMDWRYKGISYFVNVDKGSDMNAVIEALEEYIKMLEEE